MEIGAFIAKIVFASVQLGENILERRSQLAPSIQTIYFFAFNLVGDELAGERDGRTLARRRAGSRNQLSPILGQEFLGA
jgi:hypothetical protein